MNIEEEWRDVIGYEELYQVSNIGRVRSFVFCTKRPEIPHMMKPQKDGHGYFFITFSVNGKHKMDRVHTLVLNAFDRPRPEGMVGNHKNGIITDNKIENLEWCTQAENNLHSYRVLGRCKVIKRGEDNGFSKLSNEKVQEIRQLRKADPTKWTFRNLAKTFGIALSHTKRIIDREAWKHIAV